MGKTRVFVLAALAFAAGSCHGGNQNGYDHIVLAPERGMTDLPSLPPPLEYWETEQLREGFDWASTTPLPETDEEGNPALYYMHVYVESRDVEDVLALSGIYYDAMPLFPQELSRWDGQSGYIHFRGDDDGAFVFAFLAGAAFNRLREMALAGDPLVSVIVPRAVPDPDASLPSGALSYSYLADRGFTGVSPHDPLAGIEDAVPEGPEKRRRMRIIHSLRGLANGIREGIAAIRRLGGQRTVSLRLRIFNTDPAFYFPGTDPQTDKNNYVADDRNLMRRAWGSQEDRGSVIAPHGVPVFVSDNLGLSHAHLDRNGFVRIRTPDGPRKDNRIRVFVRLSNQAARFYHLGPFEDRLFLDLGHEARPGKGDVHTEVSLVSRKLQILTQMTDTWDYSAGVLGFRPDPAVVRDAGMSSPFPVSTTVCLSHLKIPVLRTVIGATVGADNWAGLIAGILTFPANVPPDIVMISGRESRLLPTHEYGHWIWCSMMATEEARFVQTGPQALRFQEHPTTVRPGNLLSESYADFITSQVAGGANYMRFDADSVVSSRFGPFCDPVGQAITHVPCADDNVGGPVGGFPAGSAIVDGTLADGRSVDAMLYLGRAHTVMVDFFDGHPFPLRSDMPGNGTGWYRHSIPQWFGPAYDDTNPSHVFRPSVPIDPHFADEGIALEGRALRGAVEDWWIASSSWRSKPFLRALSREALRAGASADEVCRLLSNHSRNLDCTDLIGAVPELFDARRSPLEGFTITTAHASAATAPTWTGAWFDPSRIGSERYVVRALRAGTDEMLLLESVPWVRDLRPMPHASAIPLPFDTHLDFWVRAMPKQQAAMGGPISQISLWTPAQPVQDVAVLAMPGSATVSWTPTQASAYAVRLRVVSTGAVRWMPNTTASSLVIGGLTNTLDYTVEVFAVNGAGERSVFGSPPQPVTPLPPSYAYVSAVFGDDARVDRGTEAHPYRTLGLALAEAPGRGYSHVRVHAGTYVEPTAIVLGSGIVSVEGRWTVIDGAWARLDGPGSTSVEVPVMHADGPAYRTTSFLAAAPRALYSGIHVASGAQLMLDGIDVRATGGATAGSDCGAAVSTAGGGIVLSASTVSTTSVGPSGCRFGVHARGNASVVLGDGAVVVGYATAAPSLPAALSAAGLVTIGSVSVSLEGAEIIGMSAPAVAQPNVAGLLGMGQEGIASTAISRATIRALDGDRLASVATTGALVGLDIAATQSVTISNSVVLAPRSSGGSSSTTGLRIRGPAAEGALSSVRLYYDTIAAGGDWLRSTTVSPPGTAVRFEGRIQSVVMKNSLLVVGQRTAWAAIDVSMANSTTVAGSAFEMRGNALAIAWRTAYGTCFGGTTLVSEPEYFVFSGSGGCTEFGYYTVGDTPATVPSALARFGVVAVSNNWFQDNAVGVGPESEGRAPWLDRDGRVIPVNSVGTLLGFPTGTVLRLDEGGVALTGGDPSMQVGVDRAGLVRMPGNGQLDIGAFAL